MEELIRRLIGEDILLVTILGSGLGNVKADPHQLEQVIMNLAVNARDAMPGGGRLIIESKNVRMAAEFHGRPAGDYALVSVSDTGHGMSPEIAARIFEPFFTTKELGNGTGLGLATVFGIVEQSDGVITVESSPGAGASFRVYLPVHAGADEQAAAQAVAPSGAARAGTILVVEDEAPLRRLVVKILRGAGYTVLEAASGEEGITLAGRERGLDLLLTDVIMPNLSGPEMVKRLRAARPELAVLFMSGYDNALIDRAGLDRTASFLPKPFSPRALLAKVNEVIWGEPEGGQKLA
jgi:two-component system cell cycle sensor histidine kinase/response regulator CckA